MANRTTPFTTLLAVTLITMLGCDKDQRLAEMARDATQRQAEQNREMAQLNREVAVSNKRLIEGDAQARQEVLQVQRELVERDAVGRQDLNALQREVQAAVSEERSSLDRQHEGLEEERREIAKQRNRLTPNWPTCWSRKSPRTDPFCLALVIAIALALGMKI